MENTLEVKVGKYLGYLATDPDNPHLILETVQMLNRLGRFPEALDLIEHGQSVTPDDPALAFTKSTVALSSNNPGLAIEILENLLATGNDNGAIRYNLAYSLALQGEMEKAQTVIEPSLSEIETKTSEVLILLARIKHYLGDVEDAIKLIESFLLKYPDHNQLAQAQGILALLAMDTQDLQSARMHAVKSLSTDPNNPDSLVTMGSIALEEFDSNSAKNHFDRVLAQHPTNGRAWLGTGLAYMLDQELGKAEDALTQCVEHMPTHLGSWNTLAWCQIAQNKIDRAENTLLKALDLNRNFAETHGGLAMVALFKDNPAQAQQHIKRALGLDSGCFSANYAQSVLHASNGNNDLMQKMVTELLHAPIGTSGKTIKQALQAYASKNTRTKR